MQKPNDTILKLIHHANTLGFYGMSQMLLSG